jgi:hypothetical protein
MNLFTAFNSKSTLSLYSKKTMKHLTFDAHLNLKSEPNELIVFGSIVTERLDDHILLEMETEPSVIETVLLLHLKVIEGIEPTGGNMKPFVFNLNDKSSKHYTNVTIMYGQSESKTQIVKIIG